MLISVQSTDPESYNTVRTNFDIPWKCEYIKYYVSSINTNCNILMTTTDDVFEYYTYETKTKNIYDEEEEEEEEEEYREVSDITTIHFQNRSSYTIKSIEDFMNKNTRDDIKWEYDNNKRVFIMKMLKNISIERVSHRVALLLGLYNYDLPSDFEANEEDEHYPIQDIPILNHTKFYLVSLQGNPMYANIGEKQHTPSIIGNIDTITRDGKPIIYNFEKEGKPLKIKTYTESLKNLEISLVDFQFQPIILKSPLSISVKIKPAKDVDVKDILTK